MIGIRWTTSSTGASGQGNSKDNGRKFIRSENIDMLLGVLDFANSTAAGSSKNLPKAPKSLKDVLEKETSSSDVVDGLSNINDLSKKAQKANKYDSNGHTCSFCERVRHDNLDYEDIKGNKLDGQTQDTLQKAK